MANARIVNTPSQAIAQSGTSHRQKTVSNTAVSIIDFTPNAQTSHFLVQFLGATARVTFDGSDPTTTKGFEYVAGTSAYWTKTLAIAAKGIRAGGTDVTVEIQELNYL